MATATLNTAIKKASSQRPLRLTWQLKIMLPVAAALFNGLLLFVIATLSLAGPERHTVLLLAAIGAIIVCAVMVVSLALIVRRPMLELEHSIERVSEGDLQATVSFADRHDDIGDLGRNFNQMVQQLRESRQEIERLHATQMSRAEHLVTLGELAAGLAHEIRNPLAGIAGVMEIIARDVPSTSPAQSVLKDVQDEVLRINRIVTDLLETARPKPPQMQPADLNVTVEHALMFAREQAKSKPIQFHLIKCPDLPVFEHDTAQIHQVLLNLMLNAIQAIDGPGTVTVLVQQRNGMAAVEVRDTGPGISPAALGNIFRPFFTTKGHGTGLGLSLAKRIVEDHGGKIEVASFPGQGCSFSVLLPMRAAQNTAAAPY
jgi:signal transduction histidine kinase